MEKSSKMSAPANINDIPDSSVELIFQYTDINTLAVLAEMSFHFYNIAQSVFQEKIKTSETIYFDGEVDVAVLRMFGEHIRVIHLNDINGQLKHVRVSEWSSLKIDIDRYCTRLTRFSLNPKKNKKFAKLSRGSAEFRRKVKDEYANLWLGFQTAYFQSPLRSPRIVYH